MESAFRSEQDKDFQIGIVSGKLKKVTAKSSRGPSQQDAMLHRVIHGKLLHQAVFI
jgi:hypothetical protein